MPDDTTGRKPPEDFKVPDSAGGTGRQPPEDPAGPTNTENGPQKQDKPPKPPIDLAHILNDLLEQHRDKLGEAFMMVVGEYVKDKVASRTKEFFRMVATFIMWVFVLGGVVGLYIVFVWKFPCYVDDYTKIVLSFLAGGGVAALLGKVSAGRSSEKKTKEE